jgi:hypothetical protein
VVEHLSMAAAGAERALDRGAAPEDSSYRTRLRPGSTARINLKVEIVMRHYRFMVTIRPLRAIGP